MFVSAIVVGVRDVIVYLLNSPAYTMCGVDSHDMSNGIISVMLKGAATLSFLSAACMILSRQGQNALLLPDAVSVLSGGCRR